MREPCTYREALDAVLARAAERALPCAELESEDAIGFVCAGDVVSGSPVPPFRGANLDGFAVRSSELRAAADRPQRLTTIGHVAAGDAIPPDAVAAPPGSAWEVMTGAPMPTGFDALVPLEEVTVLRDTAGRTLSIEIGAPVAPGANVRAPGADFGVGALVVPAGTIVGPGHVLALAAVGQQRLRVRARPRVAVLSTGKELVPASTRPLAPGQVRNSTLPYLRGTLRRLGAEIVSSEAVGDDRDALADALGRALAASPDVVLTTGGVSVGRHDLVADALADVGARVVFHRVAMRPGKPTLFAEFPRGDGGARGPVVFGLPGNPGATAAGTRFLVNPYLRAVARRAPEQPARAALAEPEGKPFSVRCFLAATFFGGAQGTSVRIVPHQASFKTSVIAAAEAWAVLPEGTAHLAQGATIDVFPAL